MQTKFRYLIYDQLGQRFRTLTAWIKEAGELLPGEKMLSSNDRNDIDKLINSTGFKNCCSWGIPETHPLYKYC